MLVDAEVEDAAVLVENVLGAVAVVHVPVDDGDALQSVDGAGVTGRDGDIVEDAETHAPVGGGVVSGRADCTEGVAVFPGDHGVDRFEQAPGSAPGNGQGARAEVGVASAE